MGRYAHLTQLDMSVNKKNTALGLGIVSCIALDHYSFIFGILACFLLAYALPPFEKKL